MSIPALVISMNALSLSQQQRADALAQRSEDQREKARAKAEAAALAKTAFVRNIVYWWEPNTNLHYIRNANSGPANVFVVLVPESPDKEAFSLFYTLAPCSQAAIPDPIWSFTGPSTRFAEGYTASFVVGEPDDRSAPFWSLTEGKVDVVLDGLEEVTVQAREPRSVIKGVTPCH
jgi:hypothetical protein